MEVRPNSQLAIIKAEILGKTARGGGASWGPISEFVKDAMCQIVHNAYDFKIMVGKYAGKIIDELETPKVASTEDKSAGCIVC